jgi:hypothetical protein
MTLSVIALSLLWRVGAGSWTLLGMLPMLIPAFAPVTRSGARRRTGQIEQYESTGSESRWRQFIEPALENWGWTLLVLAAILGFLALQASILMEWLK